MSEFALEPFVIEPVAPDWGPRTRMYQGVPSVVRLKNGRFFVVWYANATPCEGPGNYLVLNDSSDGGFHWNELLMVRPFKPECQRVFDPVIWLDPAERLWLFWSQCHSENDGDCFDGRNGVFAACCENPAAAELVWSSPRRLGDGVMMNKPIVTANGNWILPVALWNHRGHLLPELEGRHRSNLLISRDQGATFEFCLGPDIPCRGFDEHVVVEKKDGSLWLLARTGYGIGEAVSTDGGATWSEGRDSGLGGPSSRFALQRLKSGRLLLVNNLVKHLLPGEMRYGCDRFDLTAWLSDDDGKSWYGRMTFDCRPGVSYPDFCEGADGFIYCVYDRNRQVTPRANGEILMSRFTETDVASGQMVVPGAIYNWMIASFPPNPERQAETRMGKFSPARPVDRRK